MPHPEAPVHPLNQGYIFRNTSCTSPALQVILLFSETHKLQRHQKAPHFNPAAQGAGNGAVPSQLHKQWQRDLFSGFQKTLWFWFPLSHKAAFTVEKPEKASWARRSVYIGSSSVGTSCLHPQEQDPCRSSECCPGRREQSREQHRESWSRPAEIKADVKQRMEQHRGAVVMLWLEQCR